MAEAVPLTTATDFNGLARLRADAAHAPKDALPEVARQFESLFTQMMLKSMRAVSFGDDLTGQQGGLYRDMLDQQLAVHLSSGKGLGIANLLVQQLRRGFGGETPATDSAAPADTPAMTPTAAGAGRLPAHVRAALADAARCESPQASSSDEAAPVPLTAQQSFVAELWPHAQDAARELGVSPRVLVAQAALETGWGRHQPRHADGTPSNNLFGIKAGRSWDGDAVRARTREFGEGGWRSESARFRAYDSVGESLRDYVSVLKERPRFSAALAQGGDDLRYARALQKAGYATDPGYAGKLADILNSRVFRSAVAVADTAHTGVA